jgi:predicted 3-demethylubiquinone-9 3-methyltransferase (glyoxalase superfamily)
MATFQKITPNLWFNTEAEEAATYYTSIFKNSKIGDKTFYGKEGFEIHHMPDGTVLTIEFELEGQQFLALNGGPIFKFNESVSFIINCKDQEEIDYFWNKLKEGGDEKAQQCGWLKDKFGLSWQVTPQELNEMFKSKDTTKTERLMKALMPMKKLDLNELKKAFNG